MSQPGTGVARSLLLLAVVLLVAGFGLLAFVFLRPQGPELVRVEPDRARPGDTVVLHGARFDATAQNNTVLFEDRTGRVIGASLGELKVEVPAFEMAEGEARHVGVRVLVGNGVSGALDLQLYREAALTAAEPGAEGASEAPPVETTETTVESEPGGPAVAAGTDAAPPAPRPRPRPARPTPAPAAPPVTLAPTPLPAPALVVPPAQRRFVLERTAVESNKRASGGLDGFESESVDLKRAPDVLGRVDFGVEPAQVKPGDRYTVNVYLINDGRKAIKLKDMFVATNVNGRLVSSPANPRTKDVPPKGRAVVASFTDTWRDTTATWAMDVTVTSAGGDVYKNQIVWK